MTARIACYLISVVSIALGAALLGSIIAVQMSGVILVVLIFTALGAIFIGLDALVCALFRTRPGQRLGDDVLNALLNILLEWK